MAISNYEKAAELNPKDVTIFTNLGQINVYKKDFEKSIEYYKKALELNPNYAFALNGLGSVLFLKGEKEEAYSQFKKAKIEFENLLRLDDRSDLGMYYRISLGGVYVMLHEYKKAISMFKKIFKYNLGDSHYAAAHYGMAGAYSMQNNKKAAFKNLEKAIKLGGYIYIANANIDPVFDNIRNEDKFIKLISTSE